jgi:hypothetical protein
MRAAVWTPCIDCMVNTYALVDWRRGRRSLNETPVPCQMRVLSKRDMAEDVGLTGP